MAANQIFVAKRLRRTVWKCAHFVKPLGNPPVNALENGYDMPESVAAGRLGGLDWLAVHLLITADAVMPSLHRLEAKQEAHERIGCKIECGHRLAVDLLALPIAVVAGEPVTVQNRNRRVTALFAPKPMRSLKLGVRREFASSSRQRTRQRTADGTHPVGDFGHRAVSRTIRINDPFGVERHRDRVEVFRFELRVFRERHDQAVRDIFSLCPTCRHLPFRLLYILPCRLLHLLHDLDGFVDSLQHGDPFVLDLLRNLRLRHLVAERLVLLDKAGCHFLRLRELCFLRCFRINVFPLGRCLSHRLRKCFLCRLLDCVLKRRKMLLHKRADLCVPAQLPHKVPGRYAVLRTRICDFAAVGLEYLYCRESADLVLLDKPFVVPPCRIGEKRLVPGAVDKHKHKVLLGFLNKFGLGKISLLQHPAPMTPVAAAEHGQHHLSGLGRFGARRIEIVRKSGRGRLSNRPRTRAERQSYGEDSKQGILNVKG